jgi:hypothetical protein
VEAGVKHHQPPFPLTKKEINMEYFIYILLAFAGFTSVFMLGWQFGLWMQSLDDRKAMRDLYTKDDDFHNVYYTDNKCKYTASCCKPKAKAKKNPKKK